jgi:hypothetical protein
MKSTGRNVSPPRLISAALSRCCFFEWRRPPFGVVRPCNLLILGVHRFPRFTVGVKSMSLTLVAIARNENGIDLTYEEIIGDPRPFVLTVTPTHVAHQVSRHLPITTADMQSYVLACVANLEATARKCKEEGLTAQVLL